MSWKHEYLERAQRIANMQQCISSPDVQLAWASLEDDIQGKLALWQCADLYDFVADIPCQGSLVIMEMLPDDLPTADVLG